MPLVLKDRVKESTTSTGTGTITLAGAATGFQSFSVIGNANTCYYAIVGTTEWEVGVGTYTSAGTTLSRDSVLESSNAGALVNFSAGIKDVFVTYPAELAVMTDAAQTLTNKTLTAPVISSIVNTGTLTLPTSTDTLVGRATTDTLTNKTLTEPTIIGTIIEDVYSETTASATLTLNPANGSIQVITLGQAATSVDVSAFVAGEGVTLMIADGTSNFTINWSTSVVWVGGVAPTLVNAGFTVVELWKRSTVVYGAIIGDVA